MYFKLLLVCLVSITCNSCLWNYRENLKNEGSMKDFFDLYDELSKKYKTKELETELVQASAAADSVKIKACYAKIEPVYKNLVRDINNGLDNKHTAKFIQVANTDKFKVEQVWLTKVANSNERGTLVPQIIIELKIKIIVPFRRFDEIRLELINIRDKPYMSMYSEPKNDSIVEFYIQMQKDNKEFSYFNIQ